MKVTEENFVRQWRYSKFDEQDFSLLLVESMIMMEMYSHVLFNQFDIFPIFFSLLAFLIHLPAAVVLLLIMG